MIPTICHPITKKIIHLYSDEVNQLFNEGYTEDDVLKCKNKFTGALTYLKDVDYLILLYMKIYPLITLSQTNKYTNNLCKNKDFWLNKINYDFVSLPDKSLIADMNGIKIYHLCDRIHHYLPMRFYVHFDKDMIADLIIKYIPEDDRSLNLDGVIDFTRLCICQPYNKHRFMVQFIDNSGGYYDDTAFDKQTLINFLFDGLKNKIIYLNKSY